MIVILGPGRSGTSVMAGALANCGLGYKIPGPLVPPTTINPRGTFENSWVVDFHKRILRRNDMTALDVRPTTAYPMAHDWDDLKHWVDTLPWPGNSIVKDPRAQWFMPMWDSLASARFIVMLRHPTAQVKSRGGISDDHPATRLAGWINAHLTILENRTAHTRFAQYESLLADWRKTLQDALGLPGQMFSEVNDEFIDRKLQHNLSIDPWPDEIPWPLRWLAEDLWVSLLFEEPGPRKVGLLRDRYNEMLDSAVALSAHTIQAARRETRRQTWREVRENGY